jgi:hypothetical protein
LKLPYHSTINPEIAEKALKKPAKKNGKAYRARLRNLKKANKARARKRKAAEQAIAARKKLERWWWEHDNSMDGGWRMTRKLWNWREKNKEGRPWANWCCVWELSREDWRWIWHRVSRFGYSYDDRHNGKALNLMRIDSKQPFRLDNMRLHDVRTGKDVWCWNEREALVYSLDMNTN